METAVYLNNIEQFKIKFFEIKKSFSISENILLALFYACLTGLMAQITFYLPWTLVPATGQTFAVLLGAVLLGRWAGVSQIIYTAAGVMGVPWFAGLKGGIIAIAGPTGGYILGFILASFILGYIFDKYPKSKSQTRMFFLMILVNFLIIYTFGIIHLYALSGFSLSLYYLLSVGVFPFVVGDIIKILAAVFVSKSILPKEK